MEKKTEMNQNDTIQEKKVEEIGSYKELLIKAMTINNTINNRTENKTGRFNNILILLELPTISKNLQNPLIKIKPIIYFGLKEKAFFLGVVSDELITSFKSIELSNKDLVDLLTYYPRHTKRNDLYFDLINHLKEVIKAKNIGKKKINLLLQELAKGVRTKPIIPVLPKKIDNLIISK